MKKIKKKISQFEFVALMGMMMALVALSIDAMLPALGIIGTDLNVANTNNTQLIVSFLFIGLAAGQIFYGPLSDSIGRKNSLYLGFLVYITGCFLSLFSGSLSVMLAGRVLQGFGAAGPRIVSVAIVRDQFSGKEMAKIMSFIMVIFILVPMIAPTLGQGILLITGWRAIFGAFLALGLIILIWFYFRQPETLPSEKRTLFSFNKIFADLKEIFTNRFAIGYTVISGFISSAFLGYLSLVQPIFQIKYELGDLFPLFFALLAVSIGSANYLNGKLVMKFGMKKLSRSAIIVLTILSLAGTGITFIFDGSPDLWVFMTYLMLTLFCVGIIWGNLNAMAMEPLGHIAGIGAAVVGSVATIISVPFGILIGRFYENSVSPVIIGFLIFGFLSLILMHFIESKN